MITIQNTVSVGDLFTGLSVLVSAGGIVFSTFQDRQKRRKEVRATVLNSTLQSLVRVFEDGLNLAEKISWQQVGEASYTAREIVDFGYKVINQIRSLRPNYLIWATKDESNALDYLEKYIREWQTQYALSLESRKNIPDFGELLRQIEDALLGISKMIHNTV
ncbi:hypothetical protein [Acidocella facilis]|uniref:hypothetical protein n=1 Tax=Acidocella facilis TaxID=525 RepID=UPI0012DC9C2F|nr:hypothetical protein [Acidocella facilis]